MWGEKLGFIIAGAFTFPFKNYSKIIDLYSYILPILLIAFLYYFTFEWFYMELITHLALYATNAYTLIFIIAISSLLLTSLILFTIIPYTISIIRMVVKGEHASPSISKAFFEKRTLLTFWAAFKVQLVPIPFITLILFLSLTIDESQNTFGLILDTIVTPFLHISIYYLSFRIFMAPILAALDKKSTLTSSFYLTRGNFWLIFISFNVCLLGPSIALFSALLIFASLFYLLSFSKALLIIFGLISLICIIFLAICLLTIPIATMGYLYLVITDQFTFKKPALKS